MRQLLDLVVDERDIRSVHGDVAAQRLAHCDADIGGLIGADVDELFDARAGAGDGQLFEKTAELHDERDLTRGEVFADADRRDQREQDEHVCLDVERRDKADDGL